ncbi:hypothetical protein [Pseudidiomarina sp.]|uniref:hypothetical protein n=1 Tax=Pseudidiomarina sp. TaxID=2081707 RepID=UPI003A976D4F
MKRWFWVLIVIATNYVACWSFVVHSAPVKTNAEFRETVYVTRDHWLRGIDTVPAHLYKGIRMGGYYNFEGRFTVSLLLGEPVVNCVTRLNSIRDGQTLPSEGYPLYMDDEDVEVYNLNLVAQVRDPQVNYGTRTVYGITFFAVFCDAGIVGNGRRGGFNVAGSPNWDNFICGLPTYYKAPFRGAVQADGKDKCLALGGKWLDATTAKKLITDGLQFNEVSIYGFQNNVSRYVRNYEKYRWSRLKQQGTANAGQQLERVKTLDERLRDADQQQLDYKAALHALAERYVDEQKYELAQLRITRDRETELYGLRLGQSELWIVEPKYQEIREITERGTVVVLTGKDEYVRTDNKVIRATRCGRVSEYNVTDTVHRREVVELSIRGDELSRQWEEYVANYSGYPGIVLCSSG